MRVTAAALSLLLFAPPQPNLDDPFALESAEQPNSEPAEQPDSESTLDCMLDDDCGSASESASLSPKLISPVEKLKTDARGLVATGKLSEAIAVFEEAYQLAPGDHIIAYEIALAAWALQDCDKTRTYLVHFVRYADYQTYPDKHQKASRILSDIERSECKAVNSEVVSKAVTVAARPKERHAGDGLMVGGAVMLGVGVLALGTGIALIAVGGGGGGGGGSGPMCTIGKPCGNTCIEISDTCHVGTSGSGTVATESNPGMVGGGAALMGVGLGLTIGGGVMFLRGSWRANGMITLTPTGVGVRF